MKTTLISFFFFNGLMLFSDAADWGYGAADGPNKWNTLPGNGKCAGNKQSPINFPRTSEMTYDSLLESFSFSNYGNASLYTLKLKNNGHTAIVEVTGDVYVQGGSLGEQYKTAQFHFHWGGDSSVGSEHVYNGASYPLELHIVNYNYKKYTSLGDAASKDDGLAVLGYFFQVSSTDNPRIAPLTNLLSQIPHKGNETTLSNFPLTNIIGMNHDAYYRYQGSLTTPPCYESVKWTVFYEKMMISENQLTQFRSLYFDNQTPMINNYRPPLSLGNRTVYTSFQIQMKWSYHGSSGPDKWSTGYPECSKNQQSPINLPPWIEMEYSTNMKPFVFENFDDQSKYTLTLKNNGHAVQVDVNGDVYVSGGNLGAKFKTAQFHFHWGSNDMRGSEHTYNGQTFPLELHIVNYNYAKYASLSEAANKPDGLAVLGYFFEVADIHNCYFSPILNHLSSIKKKGYSKDIGNYTLSNILGKDHTRYYRYQGSLTTPPCYESVTWTIFFERLPISVEQLAAFRSLYGDKYGTEIIVDNWRYPMPRNNRKVYISFDVSVGSATSLVFSATTIAFTVLCQLL